MWWIDRMRSLKIEMPFAICWILLIQLILLSCQHSSVSSVPPWLFPQNYPNGK